VKIIYPFDERTSLVFVINNYIFQQKIIFKRLNVVDMQSCLYLLMIKSMPSTSEFVPLIGKPNLAVVLNLMNKLTLSYCVLYLQEA
jgi:hypothetical protein